MPIVKNIQLQLNNENVELGEIDKESVELSFTISDPESWQEIHSNNIQFEVPCTKNNDSILNTYHNSDIEDLSPGQSFRNLMDCCISVNGSIPILRGKALLESATGTDKPESYQISIVGGSGDWIIDMQNLTLWECLNTTPHNFTVHNIERSWLSSVAGGYDSDEFHDYVYAPVRYRQPFQYANPNTNALGEEGLQITNAINIYMLRPSISMYWIIIRAFRQFGYTVSSQFLNSAFFRRQVMPWTWGDFYDINSQLVNGICFKAYGTLPDTPGLTDPHPGDFYTGTAPSGVPPPTLPWSVWSTEYGAGDVYVFSRYSALDGAWSIFKMPNTSPPEGFDNFGLYSFDESTGTMAYFFNPPAGLTQYIGTNISLNFVLELYFGVGAHGGTVDFQLEITNSRTGLVSINSLFPDGLPISGGTWYPINFGADYPFVTNGLIPTVANVTVPNVNIGDTISFRLKIHQTAGPAAAVIVMSAGFLNANPTNLGADQWQYDFATTHWGNVAYPTGTPPTWQPMYSSFTMKGLLIQLGNPVNFQYYDSFRNFQFLEFLGGLVDAYDLEVSTDPINKTVTIEPFTSTKVSDFDVDGNYISDLLLDGYYSKTRILDWTLKQDNANGKGYTNINFNESTRQIDFNFKQDGSDGGQNIWSARNLGIYLNNVVRSKINNTQIDNGIIAGIPGASRFMFPNRFSKGNTQKTNGFFSTCLHYKESNFKDLYNTTPQFITIFPENISDSSAEAVSAVFQPKIAFWKGLQDPAGFGGWRWVGDPMSPYTDGGFPNAIGFSLPYMFSVNYNNNSALIVGGGNKDPILSYCDQLTYDNALVPQIAQGLMSKFHLPRLSIMRNGQLKKVWMRLNLNDICNFGHRECIIIGRSLFILISIENFKPLTDDSCLVTLWKVDSTSLSDLDNCYPSVTSITTEPLVLSQYDLRYSQLLLFPTDIPQVG